MKNTPQQLGFKMPAEWERHDAIWLAWPHDLDSFPNLKAVEKTYTQIISAVHTSERVELLVLSAEMKSRAEKLLIEANIDLSQVRFHPWDYTDAWMRDCAPTFVISRAQRRLGMVKWIFNSWGNKYPELLKDGNVPDLVHRITGVQFFEPKIVMEGGSIEVNGLGTLLTTERCLLNPNRNPKLSRQEIENYLREYLGVSNIIWLKEGIVGDDTDGHIDDLARFVNPSTILATFEDDESDENFAALKENYDILTNARDEQGRAFKVVKLPMPKVIAKDGRRLPASYANFYIGNGKVLVPIFSQTTDRKALKIIRDQFRDREDIGIECSDMVYGFGTIHCCSQQQPAV